MSTTHPNHRHESYFLYNSLVEPPEESVQEIMAPESMAASISTVPEGDRAKQSEGCDKVLTLQSTSGEVRYVYFNEGRHGIDWAVTLLEEAGLVCMPTTERVYFFRPEIILMVGCDKIDNTTIIILSSSTYKRTDDTECHVILTHRISADSLTDESRVLTTLVDKSTEEIRKVLKGG